MLNKAGFFFIEKKYDLLAIHSKIKYQIPVQKNERAKLKFSKTFF